MAFQVWSAVAGDTTLAASGGNTSSSSATLTLASGGAAILAGILAREVNPHPGTKFTLGIEDELVIVDDINTSADTILVQRGAFGSTAATHGNSTKIHALTPYCGYKRLKAAVLTVAPGS
jgi:hypothetical protein